MCGYSITPHASEPYKILLLMYSSMSRVRSRGWCFTINNYTFEDCINLMDIPFDYLVVGFEVGENGTEHIQGYLHMESQLAFSSMKVWLPRAHLECARGTPEQASIYCKKDGVYIEMGELPVQGKLKFEQIEAVMKDPKSNFALYNQYRRSYESFMLSDKKSPEKRFLIFIPEDEQYNISGFHGGISVFMDSDLDTYQNEEVIVIECYRSMFPVDKWFNGYPKRIKRGYEIMVVDPAYVYVLYSTNKELSYLKKVFSSIEYSVWLRDGDLGRDLLNDEVDVDLLDV